MNNTSLPKRIARSANILVLLAFSAAHAQEAVRGADVMDAGFPNFTTIPQTTWCNEYPPNPLTCPDTMFGGCDVSKKCAEAIDDHFETPGDAALLEAVDAACITKDICGDTAMRLSRLLADREAQIANFRCESDDGGKLLERVSTDPTLPDKTCRDRLGSHFRALAAQRCQVLAKVSQCNTRPPPLDTRCSVTAAQAKELGGRETALCAWTVSRSDGVTAYLAECPRVSNGEDEAQCLSAPLMRERLERGVCTKLSAVKLHGPALSSEPLDLVMAPPPGLPKDDACLFGRTFAAEACGPAATGVRVGHAVYHQRIQPGAMGQIAAFFRYQDDPDQLSVIRFLPNAIGKDFPATRSPAPFKTFFGQAPMLCSTETQERLTAQAYKLRRMSAASDIEPLPLNTIPAPVLHQRSELTPLSLGDCGWQKGRGLLCWRHLDTFGKTRERLATWRPLATLPAFDRADAEPVASVLRQRMETDEGQIHVAARGKDRVLTWSTSTEKFAAYALSPLRQLTEAPAPFDAAWLARTLDLTPAEAKPALRWWLARAPLTAAVSVPDSERICWRQGVPGPEAQLMCGVYGSDAAITQPLFALPEEDRRKVTGLVGNPAAGPFFQRLAELPADCLMRWIQRDNDAPNDIMGSAFLLECGAGGERFWMSVIGDTTTTLTLSDPGAMALLAERSFATREQADAHRAGATHLRLHSPVPGTKSAAVSVLSARIGTCTKVRDTDNPNNKWIDLGDLLAPDLAFFGGATVKKRADKALACLDNRTSDCEDLLISWRPFLRPDQILPGNVRNGLICDD